MIGENVNALAVSETASFLSLMGQIGSVIGAIVVARLLAKSRSAVWTIAVVGAFGAFLSLVLADGQGAFLLVVLVPVIYAFATVGRTDLDRRK